MSEAPALIRSRPPSITFSGKESLAGEDIRDQDLSDDEDLSPDLPSFMGLFKPQIFRSLLHKAKTTTSLGLAQKSSKPNPGVVAPSVPLFEEPIFEAEEIPGPKLFKDVLQRQWAFPASGPNPNTLDRQLYNFASDQADLLQLPSVDPPIVALAGPSNLMGPTEDSLKPEDKRLDLTLAKAHQAMAWSVRSALADSFFNWASILWLRQLQDRLPLSDPRSQQDVNKILAALEFSANATLNSSCFVAKNIGSTVVAHHLLWLHQWQADAKSKWRLATSPFMGPNLFGAPLEQLLVESKDKCCILPNMSRRSELWVATPFHSFRGSDSEVFSLQGQPFCQSH